jgi:DNA-binding transcriptional MerR regulator
VPGDRPSGGRPETAGGVRPFDVGSFDVGSIEDASRGRATGSPPRTQLATGDVVRVIGVSRRQLQYWAETGLVAPSARTPGGHRRYTFADLVALKATKQLIDAGVSVQRIRSSLGSLKRTLPQVRHPLSELVLVATGDVVLVLREGSAFEALSGQEWIVEVAQFQRDIERVLGSSETAPSNRQRSRNAIAVANQSGGEARSA